MKKTDWSKFAIVAINALMTIVIGVISENRAEKQIDEKVEEYLAQKEQEEAQVSSFYIFQGGKTK